MKTQRFISLSFFALTVWLCQESGLASHHPPGTKRSKSDANINAIGHRHIDRGPNFYSLEKEKQIGKAMAEENERSSMLLNDPTVMEYIDKLAQNVAKNSDTHIPITVRVIDSDEVTTSTLPGGYQYFSRGFLLRLENQEQLVSALARGIAHTALRSGTRDATNSEVMQLSTVPLNTLGRAGSTSTSASLALPLTQLRFRRDDEFDADYFGVQYVYKAGYDPKCFVSFVQRVWGPGSAANAKIPKNFSPYPPFEERLAALQHEISEILPARAGATVSTSEFNAIRERLKAHDSEGSERPPLKTNPPNLKPKLMHN